MRKLLFLVAGLICGCESATVDEFAPTGQNDPSNNAPPEISGFPDPAVLMANVYEFQPDASDPDGDELTFSIQNKPGWANFDTRNGLLNGQPTSADVGIYDNIRISVSDGLAEASLPAFSISVSQDAEGSITLSWQPPTENSDGSPLLDLAGYEIHYGKSTGAYNHKIRLNNPGLSSHMIKDLLPGTYYLAAVSFNSAGVESYLSGEVVRRVN